MEKEVSKSREKGKIIMTMKEVWELLETEPTSDKRIIKRAYARVTKKYHPEEYPDQFQKIYAAYKQAIEYANYVGSLQNLDADAAKQTTGQKQTEERDETQRFGEGEQSPQAYSEKEERIQKVFQNIREEHEKKLFIFRHKWEWYLKNRNKDSAKREMAVYIETHWFTDIKEEIRQMDDLKVNRKHYQILQYLLENDTKHFLYENIEKWQRMKPMPEGRGKKSKQFGRIFAFTMSVFAVILVGISYFLPKSTYSNQTNSSMDIEQEKERILTFLQETYPMAEFTEIEASQEMWYETYYPGYKKYSEGRNYIVKTANLDIRVHVYSTYKDGNLYIGEDFGQQYLRQLAEKRDLMCDFCHIEPPWNDGESHYLMLGYYNMSSRLDQLEPELTEYMERFLEFAKSEEVSEFINIEGVSFCVGNCFQPTAFIMDAGEMPKPLLYEITDLPAAKDMAEDMVYCIAEYYMHMEPWQLESDPHYDEWVRWYEERVRERNAEPTTSVGSYIVKMAKKAGVEPLIYQQGVFDCISTGDLYRLLKKEGVPVTVLDGGDGFELEDGSRYFVETILCERVFELLTKEQADGNHRN